MNTTLLVEGSSVLVARNAKHGVMVKVDAEAVMQDGVNVRENAQDGVIITTKAKGVLKGIHSLGNTWAGVRVTFDGEAEVHGCELLDNEKDDLVHELSAKLQASGNELGSFKSFLEGSNRIFPKANVECGGISTF